MLMITPHFEVSQDADFVTIRIRVPHAHMEDGEFYVQDHEFKFHLRPYFLRLTFRQLLAEDGREAATYDAAAGVLSVRVPKATPGEHFDDLGMLSELLRKPDRSAAPRRGPLIEVMSSTPAEGAEDADGASEEDGDEDDMDEAIAADCEVDQVLPSADALLGRVLITRTLTLTLTLTVTVTVTVTLTVTLTPTLGACGTASTTRTPRSSSGWRRRACCSSRLG